MAQRHPLIDSDPHASRVIRYMRLEDLGAWAAFTAGVPYLFRLWDHWDPSGVRPEKLKMGIRVSAAAGFFGGFLYAYQNSSKRFWGWSENEREQKLDMEEMTQRLKEGKSLYGETPARPWVQHAAHANSADSQLKFGALPMFNLMNHPFHGVDTAKYYEAAGIAKPQ
ncbi:hypothetical protein CYLTODRAFT_403949 [Cylindrobasidium torrendii FP15055 ss-10]|uniref:NADH-ubiquinone oxidoreductase 21 kDa subunit n=1 Tax=Cylindrobasidium torrendii FP15055 ss-10 TaxID=1314674 RepID=A0A0D7AX30_9AGAR|nr:hypothetical protein CYLTODRAFT_403949 [Cylindrobasidium torrendii FP15055 ss-10]